jgi:hypothetical protein
VHRSDERCSLDTSAAHLSDINNMRYLKPSFKPLHLFYPLRQTPSLVEKPKKSSLASGIELQDPSEQHLALLSGAIVVGSTGVPCGFIGDRVEAFVPASFTPL